MSALVTMQNSSVVLHGSDINDLMAIYDYDKKIVSAEFCETLESRRLKTLFEEKKAEFKAACDQAPTYLNKSINYSEQVTIAEKALLSMNNIKSVLFKKDKTEEDTTAFETKLSGIRDLQPIGETCLQLRDIQLMDKMMTIPANPTYTAKNGEVYIQPKVSHVSIRSFFETYCQKGGYKSVATSFDQFKYYNIKFDRPFHSINFMKTEDQVKEELKRHPELSRDDVSEVESRFPKSNSNSMAITLFTKLLPIKSAPKFSPQKLRDNRKELFEDMKNELPEVIKEWGFCDFQTLTTDEQVKAGIDFTNAIMADSILLFHTHQ